MRPFFVAAISPIRTITFRTIRSHTGNNEENGSIQDSLRIVFMGTPHFALPTLDALAASGHRVVAVYTKPPNEGVRRGKRSIRTPVHDRADQLNIPIFTPTRMDDDAIAVFQEHQADVVIVAAYGIILPEAILRAPRHGCINVHGSILPRWRGAAPVQRAIMAGDDLTGVSIMRMAKGLDTGPVHSIGKIPIAGRGCGEIMSALADMGAGMIMEFLAGIEDATYVDQAAIGTSYAKMIDKQECRLDLASPAEHLERIIRALSPTPGAWVSFGGTRLKIHAAEVVDAPHTPIGTVIDDRHTIACGQGALRITDLQWAGRSRMSASSVTGTGRLMAGMIADHPETELLTIGPACTKPRS